MGLVYLLMRPCTCSVSRSSHSNREHFRNLSSASHSDTYDEAPTLKERQLSS